MTLCSTGLEVLVRKGGTLPVGNTRIPLNCMLRILPGHFGLLITLKQQAKMQVTMLAGRLDPDYHWKIDCYSAMEVRKTIHGYRRYLVLSLTITKPCE